MAHFLDLNDLLPDKIETKIGTKTYLCTPLSLEDYIKVEKLRVSLPEIGDLDTFYETIKEIVYPFLPQVFDEHIKLTFSQFKGLIDFAIKASLPEGVSNATKEASEVSKKKVTSPEQSPSTSDSTQATQ